jgi:hypothetical protein
MFGIFKQKAPDKAWLSQIKDENQFTPDLPILEQYEHQLMFLYNECKPGLPNHKLVEESCVPLATAFTRPEFSLWKKRLGKKSFAMALKEDSKEAPFRRIKGDLVLLETSRFKELDKYMSNTVYFNRVRTTVEVPYTRIDTRGNQQMVTQSIKAWMYVSSLTVEEIAPKQTYSVIYFPVTVFNNKNTLNAEYYCFTKEEYK